MDLKRGVRDRISFVLLILGNIATALSGNNLDCTNDFSETFICHFEAQNCTEYNLILRSNDWPEEGNGTFTQCGDGQCCCSVEKISTILGSTYTATVWKGGENIESKIISVSESIKPKTPTILSVNESNGNFQVKWDANMEDLFTTMNAYVTYHKKGDTEKVSAFVQPNKMDGLNYYEILGRNLDRSTTYAVSVKSYTNISGKSSDSSKEWEFTTTMSPDVLPLAIIISLSCAAIIITGAIYVCFVKLKTKWWDTVAKCPNPKLCVIHPSEQKLLKPGKPDFSIVFVEPLVPDDSKPWSKGSLRDTSSGSLQQSSGISSGSSCLSPESAVIKACVKDSLKKDFANIGPLSHLKIKELNKDSGDVRADDMNYGSSDFDNKTYSPHNPCGVQADDMSCGSSDFDNKTFSILIPNCPHQGLTDSSEVQTRAKMLCDSAYHPIAGDIVTCVDQQTPAFPHVNSPPGVISLMPTDMSYQQCNADSGGFSYAEDSSLSSVSSGTNTIASCDPASRVEARCESSEEAIRGATKQPGKTEGAAIWDENRCCVPAGSDSFPAMDDDYQPFQNLVKQPGILFSEERSDEKEEHLNRYPEELCTKMAQSFPCFINNVQGGQCLSELQRPFLRLIPADQSLPPISDIGYQIV